MRRRALLLAFLVGGLAVAGTAGLAGSVAAGNDRPSSRTALARAELADAPAPTAFSRARDAFARDHDDRLNVSAALAVALVLTLRRRLVARTRARRPRPPAPARRHPAHPRTTTAARHRPLLTARPVPRRAPPERAPMTQATMARPHVPRRTFPPLPLIALVVVGALLCAAMAYALRDPEVVPRVTVENPSDIGVNVSVHPANDSSRLILADRAADHLGHQPRRARPGRRVDLHVLVRWRRRRHPARVTAKLAADGWRVSVPESVIAATAVGHVRSRVPLSRVREPRATRSSRWARRCSRRGSWRASGAASGCPRSRCS